MPRNLRDVFWDEVYDEAVVNKDVILVSADLGAISLDKFRENLPDQFVSVGIAEQNAITVAAGMAMEGKKVYVYACAPFINLRCYEQTRLTLAGMDLPVTIVAQGAGFSFWEFGPTHHVLEDLGTMRMLPHFSVYAPYDPNVTAAIARRTLDMQAPAYVRIDKLAPDPVHDGFSKGDLDRGFVVEGDGHEVLLIGIGSTVAHVKEACEKLRDKGVGCSYLDLFCLSPCKEDLLDVLRRASRVVTIEEHTLPCGIGSLIGEIMMDNGVQRPVTRIGVDVSEGYQYDFGGRAYLQKLNGIDAESIVEIVV